MLSPQLLKILRTYWRFTRPKRWLFPGRDDERPLVPNVLHAACHSARTAASLRKPVTVHTLRHTFADPSSGERGGRAHHPGPARSCQPLKHGALHPGRNQVDQQHAEPTRSAPLGSGATRLSRFHGTGAGNGGHFPLPWRSVSTGARWSPRVRRASHHGRHHGLPHGRARWPCRAMR